MSLTSICSTSLSSLFCPLLAWSFCHFSCHYLFIISNKNQTLIPTISTSLPYSGPKTRRIVIYVTKIKHSIDISRFSKLEFRGWKKELMFVGIKFRVLGKKSRNCEIFVPQKFLTINKHLSSLHAWLIQTFMNDFQALLSINLKIEKKSHKSFFLPWNHK